jgi:mono/diheme cytochrome c family protein
VAQADPSRSRSAVTTLLGALLLLVPPPAAQPDGLAIYSDRCIVCHGSHGVGTERGPSLADNRNVLSATAEQLRRVIAEGVPAKGMPPFDLAPRAMTPCGVAR